MALQKLTISPERGEEIKALFNPEKYTITKGVQYAEIGIPGLDSPVLQFVRGQNEKVTIELFFDTTDYGMTDASDVHDVRLLTRKVYNLTKVNPETHAPLRVTLWWGTAAQVTSYASHIWPWMVVESVSQEFTLFAPDGTPLRAKLNTTFREAWTIEEQLNETPRHSSDRTKVRRVQRGETVSRVAGTEYGDPRQWRAIAEFNDLDDPRRVAPGTVLVVPRNTSEGR
jgi:Contractile injection system tube protein/LysM domain